MLTDNYRKISADGTIYVKSVHFNMSEDYAYSMYESCSNVKVPQTSSYAFDLMCNTPVAECTPEK